MVLFYYYIKLLLSEQKIQERLYTQMAKKLKPSKWSEGERKTELYYSLCSSILFCMRVFEFEIQIRLLYIYT